MKGLADRVLVRPRRDRRHLRQQPDDRDLERLLALLLLVVRRQRADGRRAHRHRVRVLRQRPEEALEVLVQHRVPRDLAGEGRQLGARRQLPVHEQPGDLEEGAALGQLLDRVPAVAQDALLAVDVRDRAAARPGVRVARVERDHPGRAAQATDVDRHLVLRAAQDGQARALAVARDLRGFESLLPFRLDRHGLASAARRGV
jgi:hypothetical protein